MSLVKKINLPHPPAYGHDVVGLYHGFKQMLIIAQVFS